MRTCCSGDYIKESKQIAQLHKEMKSCDNILQLMEDMLGTFQKDLGKRVSQRGRRGCKGKRKVRLGIRSTKLYIYNFIRLPC